MVVPKQAVRMRPRAGSGDSTGCRPRPRGLVTSQDPVPDGHAVARCRRKSRCLILVPACGSGVIPERWRKRWAIRHKRPLNASPGLHRHLGRAFLRLLRLACLRVPPGAMWAEVHVRTLTEPILGRALGKVCLDSRLATVVARVKCDAVGHRSVRDTEAHGHSTATIASRNHRVNGRR